MARSARLIDLQRITKLKKQLRNSEYISFAVQTLAYKLTDRLFAEIKTKQR